MKKYLGYLPAIILTVLTCILTVTGFSATVSALLFLVGVLLLWFAAVLLHKGFPWGSLFALPLAGYMTVYGFWNGTDKTEIFAGFALFLFYLLLGIHIWRTRDPNESKESNRKILFFLLRILLTAVAVIISISLGSILLLILSMSGFHPIFAILAFLLLPSLLLPLIWLKKRKVFLIVWFAVLIVYLTALGTSYGLKKYDESITINTAPNINVSEYLPFQENSKIVKHDSKTLEFTNDLPRIDGAAALFPVYSAFVHAVYPETTKLFDDVFEYRNTPEGYRTLAEKNSDIFIGVYPSEEQKAYAEECDTTFVFTPIGTEAFVFFVHKDNPIESLTAEQIRGIYAGEITNWKQVGGKNEEIAAFQRNEGSGSQSMLERFMGDTPIMEAPTELVNEMMVGIIERVSNYKNKTNSIGFSFRYYVEGIIQNPDIKMISVDGIAPTAENIKNGTYPIVTPIYAVTYEENTNENVTKLLDWILSDEGQTIINETGYVGIN